MGMSLLALCTSRLCPLEDSWYSFNPSSHISNWKLNSVAWVCKRTIPTERPPLVGDVSAKFADRRCHEVSATDTYGHILCFQHRSSDIANWKIASICCLRLTGLLMFQHIVKSKFILKSALSRMRNRCQTIRSEQRAMDVMRELTRRATPEVRHRIKPYWVTVPHQLN
jgi:hypothetical protein